MRRQLHHGRRTAELFGRRPQAVEALLVVVLDGFDPAVEVDERVTVRREHALHAGQLVHAVEGGEELGQGISGRRQARDVGRDGRQDVIAGQDQTGRGVEEAQVVRCVPGRVEGHPLAPGQLDHVGVVQAPRRRRDADDLAQAGEVRHAFLAPPLIVEAGAAPRGRSEGRRPFLDVRGLDLGIHVTGLGRIPPRREAAVADDLGPRLGAQPAGSTEVVRMAVGHDHGVHPPERHVGLGQPVGRARPTIRDPAGRDRPVPHPAGPRGRSSSRGRARAWRWGAGAAGHRGRPRSRRSSPAPAPGAARRSRPCRQDNCALQLLATGPPPTAT